ncbi:tetratricopeptide repeat protein [Thermotoga sp. KOL6]|uniref:tetratricopeptide repeat protein n=1 Tax=Thermotoga sp. KOL6 TaxID=126741 RepID=UPI000C791C22|nr:tetratricopeptide repeat protein [Thermotoga sp. KOL6]PLV60178.1 hypothetical protein AS005_02505 [Thermotoga sp. KOL6]
MSSNEFEEAYFEMKEGKLETALKKFLKIAEKESSVEIWVNIGNIYRRMNYLAKAIESYKKALDLDPKNAIALFNMGCAYYQMGKYFEALSLVEKAESSGLNDSRVKVVRALCKIKLNFPNALEDLSEDQKKIVKDLVSND